MSEETLQNSGQKSAVNVPKGIAWVIFSSFGFACMSMCVRASGDVPFMQKAMFRNLIAFGQIPDVFSVAGYVLIIGTAVVVFIVNMREEKIIPRMGGAAERSTAGGEAAEDDAR